MSSRRNRQRESASKSRASTSISPENPSLRNSKPLAFGGRTDYKSQRSMSPAKVTKFNSINHTKISSNNFITCYFKISCFAKLNNLSVEEKLFTRFFSAQLKKQT
jgi:hypothetical protein